MSSDAHIRKDHGTQAETGPYIDWGPDLPARYAGGRARLLVANPWTLYLTWESATTPRQWRVEVERQDGEQLDAGDLAGGLSDVWLHVPAKTRGRVHLSRDGVRVATLPFSTPPDAPSDKSDERWGLVDASGAVHDADAVDGRALATAQSTLVGRAGYSSADAGKKA